jgi:hypothetical protein
MAAKANAKKSKEHWRARELHSQGLGELDDVRRISLGDTSSRRSRASPGQSLASNEEWETGSQMSQLGKGTLIS